MAALPEHDTLMPSHADVESKEAAPAEKKIEVTPVDEKNVKDDPTDVGDEETVLADIDDEEKAKEIVETPRLNLSDRISPVNQSQSSRSTLLKYIQEKRARKVKFFRNGDKFFNGLLYVISFERVRSFDALVEDLNRILDDKVTLPKGIRFIFSIDGKEKITMLDQFVEGGSYVCSSTDHFIRLNYLRNEKPHWVVTKKLRSSDAAKGESGDKRLESREFIKPKLVTIMSGKKPRKTIRFLLNKKTAHSFDQVLNDINEAIKLTSGAVRKVFTLSGRPVVSLADFFSDNDVFVVYGSEKSAPEDFRVLEEYIGATQDAKNLSSSKKFMRSSEGLGFQSTLSKRRISSPFVLQDSKKDSLGESSRGSFSASPLLNSSNLRPLSRTGHEYQNGRAISPSSIPDDVKKLYDIGEVIGDGNFAIVCECINKNSKKSYALKIIDKLKCKGKEHMIESEVAILRRVRHVNIVQLIEEFDIENELYLVMELVKGGDLFDVITTAKKFTEKEASVMIHDLSSALCYLHSLNIVHRDIKPENLLVVQHENGSRSLKLADFGLAVEIKQPLYTICGTPTYVAPEILAETGYGLKVDVWAAGVITYILLCGFPPFVSQTNDQDELFDQILAGRYDFTSPYWDDISKSAKGLISMMLHVDPDERFSASDVLNHPWVLQIEDGFDANVENSVSEEITLHFDHKPKSKMSASIALIACIFSNLKCLPETITALKNIIRNPDFL